MYNTVFEVTEAEEIEQNRTIATLLLRKGNPSVNDVLRLIDGTAEWRFYSFAVGGDPRSKEILTSLVPLQSEPVLREGMLLTVVRRWEASDQ